MDYPTILETGTDAEILLGSEWHPCTIIKVWWEAYDSINSWLVFDVIFPDGSKVLCSRNSIRERQWTAHEYDAVDRQLIEYETMGA